MINIIQNKDEIFGLQKSFEEMLKSIPHKVIDTVIGYQGGNHPTKVYWFEDLNFWYYFQIIEGKRSRYWNGFGLSKPEKNKNVSITCEINFPTSGVDKRIGAVFVKDNTGSVVIAHRGKIGGGRKGVGKQLFIDNYRGDWVRLKEDGMQNEFALVASLNSPRFGMQIKEFVYEVDRIKNSVSQTTIVQEGDEDDISELFSKEYAGKKTYGVTSHIEANCDHGIIVNTLADLLSKKGLSHGNDRNRDLYVLDSSGYIQSLFEVKTHISTQSIYSAIGQLYFHSINLRKKPKLNLVIPEKPNPKIVKRLNSLEINILIYKLSEDNIKIPSIEKFI